MLLAAIFGSIHTSSSQILRRLKKSLQTTITHPAHSRAQRSQVDSRIPCLWGQTRRHSDSERGRFDYGRTGPAPRKSQNYSTAPLHPGSARRMCNRGMCLASVDRPALGKDTQLAVGESRENILVACWRFKLVD